MRTKPLDEKIFKQIKGVWTDIKENVILADYLEWLNITIDDKTQFARIVDYQKNLKIYFRVWGGKITITLWALE